MSVSLTQPCSWCGDRRGHGGACRGRSEKVREGDAVVFARGCLRRRRRLRRAPPRHAASGTARSRRSWSTRSSPVRPDDELPSRIADLGWHGHGEVAVLVGTTPRSSTSTRSAAPPASSASTCHRRAGLRLVLVVGRADLPARGGDDTAELPFPEIAKRLEPGFGSGHLVLGPASRPRRCRAERRARPRGAFAVARAWRHARVPSRPTTAAGARPRRRRSREADARRARVPPAAGAQRGFSSRPCGAVPRQRGVVEATARELYVHPNRCGYRLKRVSEVIGWDATGPARRDPADGADPRLDRYGCHRRRGPVNRRPVVSRDTAGPSGPSAESRRTVALPAKTRPVGTLDGIDRPLMHGAHKDTPHICAISP